MRLLWIGDTEAYDAVIGGGTFIHDRAESLYDSELFFNARHYDAVVLLDPVMNDSTAKYLRRLKAAYEHMAVVCLSRAEDPDLQLAFLNAGADEFIDFPASTHGELVRLRIEKCCYGRYTDEVVDLGPFVLNPRTKSIAFEGERIEVSERFFRLLHYLVLHRKRYISKEHLLCALYEEPEYVSESSVEVGVNTLRSKLDKPFKTDFIKTLRQRGYAFVY